MILQDVDDKYDKKNTLPFLANCKTRSLFWHLKKMADRGLWATFYMIDGPFRVAATKALFI